MRTIQFTQVFTVLFLSLSLLACKHENGRDHDHDYEHEDAHHGHEHSGLEIVFTKAQQSKIDFAVETAKAAPFNQIIKTTAQVLPAQSEEQILVAKTNGIISFASPDLVAGKAVQVGQSLLNINAQGMADNNLSVRLAEAESQYLQTKAEYERKQSLAQENIISESELLRAKTDFQNAEVIYKNLQENFTAGKQVLRATFNGYITDVMVKNGDFAEAGQPLVRISNSRNIFIQAEVQTKYYNALAGVQNAHILLPGTGEKHNLQTLNGKLVSYGKSTDRDNPLIPVTFSINNSIGLVPGSFVEIYMLCSTTHDAISVPNEALIEEMGAFFIILQKEEEEFEKQPIVKGSTDGMRTEILSGLMEGQNFVSQGAVYVKLAQVAGTLDAHSVHVH